MTVKIVSDRSFQFTIPVLIIGAGAAGLTAALAAFEAGAEVLLLEQDKNPAGSTAMSYGGICAAHTKVQDRVDLTDETNWFYEDILAVTKSLTDPAMARVIAENAGPTVDWLTESHGFDLSVEKGWSGLGHRVPRVHFPPNRSGEELMAMLLGAVAKAGIEILTQARVTGIYAKACGTILGVEVTRPDGIEEIGCEKLILATCGFGANPELVAKFIPELKDALYFGHEGNRGDGILWGEALGAATADMGSFQSLGSLSEPERIVVPHTLLIGGGVQVNTQGMRFEDELDDISGQALTILQQPKGVCWVVYDERLHEKARATFAEYKGGEPLGAYRKAGTWGELAASTGMKAENFIATMNEVEAIKAVGGRDRFGREFAPEQKLIPPYYAVRVTGALFHTQGGLKVDAHARVLRVDGSRLPNLYAAGGAARSVSGPGGWGYLPGMGICTAVTLGRLAGRHAGAGHP